LLRSLYIKNYALIDEFSVEFESGLNIVTGETGAGKSIILGAFGLLLGDRASPDMIRAGAEKTIVEAEFDDGNSRELKVFFEANEIESAQDALVIRREVMSRGSSRGFINDSPASTQVLKSLGELLVDLHGQHEHQSLLRTATHIEMLDDFGGLGTLVSEYQSLRTTMLRLLAEIAEMKSRKARSDEEQELYVFQLREITATDPHDGEDDKIEARLRVLENAEELQSASAKIHELLYDGEGSAAEKLGVVREQLAKLAAIDTSLEEPLGEAKSALAIVSELSRWIGNYSSRVQLDSEELATLRERAQSIQRLKKKFGGTLDAVLQKKGELEEKLSFQEEFEQRIALKESELSALHPRVAKIAAKLSKSRNDEAKKLEPQIIAILKELGIEHAQFQVEIEQELAKDEESFALTIEGRSLVSNSCGVDSAQFFISTNAGEAPKPLHRVASGGEISRIMLAIKTVLAKADRTPLLIFDEIDIGISGRVAQRVGRAMKSLSSDHQTIAITHLAQIAACANAHYLAEKTSAKGMTSSRLRRLSESEHIEEVARLISGDVLTPGALENARSLIAEAAQKAPKQKNKNAHFASV
jgi:DNA repair protein RecN (Recombination protein N)